MQTRGGTFYDLGSGMANNTCFMFDRNPHHIVIVTNIVGSGKPVIAAAVYHPFSTCCGVEILEGLYSISLDILSTYG